MTSGSSRQATIGHLLPFGSGCFREVFRSHFDSAMRLPDELKHLERHSLPHVEQRLSEEFSLGWYAQMQDWDLNNANSDLTPMLIEQLRSSRWTEDERFSLMELAIACVDEALMVGVAEPEWWPALEQLLLTAPEIHASTMCYWAAPALQGKPEERRYPISERMAQSWLLARSRFR